MTVRTPDSASGSTDTAILLLAVSSVFWGSSFVSIKIGLEYVNAYDFAFLRLALASIILVSALAVRRRLGVPVFKERAIWMLGLLNGVAFALQYVGLLLTTAGKAALLANLNVIMIALLSRKIFRERFGRFKVLGVVLGIAGGVLITTGGSLSSLLQGQLIGDLLVFSSGLVWAFFIVLNKWVVTGSGKDVTQLSAVVMLATALVLMPVSIIFGGLNTIAIPIAGWFWIGFTAIFCTIVPYGLWNLALRAVSATLASVIVMLEIVAAMILSAVFLGESFGAPTVVGAGLILVSILAVAQS
jgi:drug/metabolite transporter (DMT)-like permease